MNLAKITVEELEVDDVYVGDVLKCLLNTIVFHRTLGDITPSDTECENIPELRYPYAVDLPAVTNEIDKSVKYFVSNLENLAKQYKLKVAEELKVASSSPKKTSITSQQQYTIEISFYSTKVVRTFLRSAEEHTDFERWTIPLKVNFTFDNTKPQSNEGKINEIKQKRSSNSHKQAMSRLVDQVEKRMKNILRTSSENLQHLPALPANAPFHPFKITLPSLSGNGGTWVSEFIQWAVTRN